MGKRMNLLKCTGTQAGALENFMAIGDWATYYAARTEFSAAEALHKKGLLEKREIPCGKRKVHEYRYAPSNAELCGARSASERTTGYATEVEK